MGLSLYDSTRPPPSTHRQRILVCLDRSELSEQCLPYAVTFARTFGGDITLVHDMQPRDAGDGQRAHDALSWEISRQEASGYLERLREEVSHSLGQPVEVRLEQGHPAERIVDLAREVGADLTVLGSRGTAGVMPWSLGSTVQKVLAVTRSSVLVVRPTPARRADVCLRNILVPLDGSLRTESVLPAVARMASAHGAEILLVHVVLEPASTTLHSDEDLTLSRQLAGRLEGGARGYLERLRAQLEREGATARTLVTRHTNERQCLLEIAEREPLDLIVLSAHGSACSSTRPFGSVPTYLLTHSMVPLLVFQDLPEVERGDALRSPSTRPPSSLRTSQSAEAV